MSPKNIVLFDGLCNLCNGWVALLLRLDRRQQLHFASLQGQYAAQLEPAINPNALETIVFQKESQRYEKSDAVLHILITLGSLWKGMSLFLCLPKGFRDWVYDRVAQNRYRLFGKRDTCRLPTPEEQSRFLS